jgi:hypothetical protein
MNGVRTSPLSFIPHDVTLSSPHPSLLLKQGGRYKEWIDTQP